MSKTENKTEIKTENMQQNVQQGKSLFTTKQLVTIAVLSGMAFVLQFIQMPLPIFPSFLKMDLADMPAVFGAILLGPLAGLFIELIKNLLQLPFTSSGGVGELSNFLVGTALVVPIGFVMRKNKSGKMFIVGAILGVITMAVFGAFTNLYITLPFYAKVMNTDISAFVGMATAIFPAIDTLEEFILFSIVPFNVLKGTVISIIGFILYKFIGANMFSKA